MKQMDRRKSMKQLQKQVSRRLSMTSGLKIQNTAKPLTTVPLDVVAGRIASDADCEWSPCEVLYLVATHRRNEQTSTSQKNRYLVMVKRNDSIDSSSILIGEVLMKGQTPQVKTSWDIQNLRSISLGEDDNEIFWSFRNGDGSWFTKSQVERNETVWIIAQAAKVFQGHEINLGQNVDIDALGDEVQANQTLSRFPALDKLGTAIQIGMDLFLEEETEAREFLETFGWGLEGPSETLARLSKESDSLNIQIIDILLDWEDEGHSSRASRKKEQLRSQTDGGAKNGGQGKSTVAAASIGSGSASGGGRDDLRDTEKVLDAIIQVDHDLEVLDGWIAFQLDNISDTVRKLEVIDKENSSLETSFKSLSLIRDVVSELTSTLALMPEDEKLLREPTKVLEQILQAPSLSKAEVRMAPLLQACVRLKTACSTRYVPSSAMTPAVWKETFRLQSVHAQKIKLNELKTAFCTGLGEKVSWFFEELMKHKSLSGGDKGRALVVKHFNLAPFIRAALIVPRRGPNVPAATVGVAGAAGGGDGDEDERASFGSADRGAGASGGGGTILCSLGPESLATNEIIASQELFHSTVQTFLPIFAQLLELDDSYVESLQRYYASKAADERMYSPMFRTLFRDVAALVQRQPLVSLASLPPYSLKKKFVPPVKFAARSQGKRDGAKAGGSELSWAALGVALAAVVPVIKREEQFLHSYLRIKHRISNAEAKAAEGNLVSTIFTGATGKKLVDAFASAAPSSSSSAPSGPEIDGIEALAMLVVVEQFAVDHCALQMDGFAPSAHASVSTDTSGTSRDSYCSSMLSAARDGLLRRVEGYREEQLRWVAQQKGDPKRAGAAPAVVRLPGFIQQVLEIVGQQHLECADALLLQVSQGVVDWVHAVAAQNEKYSQVVKIHNFGYLESALLAMGETADGSPVPGVLCLGRCWEHVAQERAQAEAQYVQWMIEKECPQLAAVSKRLEQTASRVRGDELALYIKRKEVVSVSTELQKGRVEDCVASMRKRLDRHMRGPDEEDRQLVDRLWSEIKSSMLSKVSSLGEVAAGSYQIVFDVKAMGEAFKKHS